MARVYEGGRSPPTDAPGPVVRDESAMLVENYHEAPTRELFSRLREVSTELARKEVELAKAEIREDIKREVAAGKRMGVAGLLALLGVQMLFVAGALALGVVIADWLAALIVAALLLVPAAVFALAGWNKHVRQPMSETRRSLEETAKWAKTTLDSFRPHPT